MTWVNIFEFARRKAYYLFQKATQCGINKDLEKELSRQAAEYLATSMEDRGATRNIDEVRAEDLDLEDRRRYLIFRDDIYVRFLARADGQETDKFGRKGNWVPRGCRVYFDRLTNDYVKVVDDYFCRRGEGRFLQEALNRGLYDFLCPNLRYVILDESGSIGGYAIRKGRQLTQYEFERYVGGSFKAVICKLTERTGLYFYDLTFHNTILDGDRLSFIDIESVLPIEWFGKGTEFSLRQLSNVDIGWSIQMKWYSPRWYRKFLVELNKRNRSAKP